MPYFHDDGTELFPDLVPTPQLCLSCKKRENPNEEILCNLTKLDQADNDQFICYSYEE